MRNLHRLRQLTQSNSTATHHLTLYRAPSGALVFGAGTVQWSFGLDQAAGAGDAGSLTPPDPAMQQATVNLLADMGAQPASLISGLTSAAASTDTTPPTSMITSPSQGASFSDGSAVTIRGTATDAGGGVVAGVEISTDGGSSWHPITTMSAADTSVTWSYSWIAHGGPSIETRAVDDSGNLEKPGTGVTVNVTCPCSIWGTNVKPTTDDSGDSASTEVGVKFTLTHRVRYRNSVLQGQHQHRHSHWQPVERGRPALASATFTNESASGWQQVDFSQPVPLSKDTTYVASYFAPNGHYSQDGSYFYTTPPMGTNPTITNVDSPPLHALRNTNGTVNGVYSNSGSSTFPTSSANASNYWVDVVFSQSAGSTPPAVTGVTPSDGSTGNPVSVAPTATFSQAVQPSTVSFTVKDSGGNGVAGTVGFNGADTVATFTPASSLTPSTTYTVTVSGAQNSLRVAMNGSFSWSFTTGAVAQCPCSIWQDAAPSGAVDAADASAMSLGVKFTRQQQRVHHRGPVLQVLRQHRDAYRQLVGRGRDVAGYRHVQR